VKTGDVGIHLFVPLSWIIWDLMMSSLANWIFVHFACVWRTLTGRRETISIGTRQCHSSSWPNTSFQLRKFHRFASAWFHCQLSTSVNGSVWAGKWLRPRERGMFYVCRHLFTATWLI